MAGDKDDLAKAEALAEKKKLTRRSLQLMGISGRIQREGLKESTSFQGKEMGPLKRASMQKEMGLTSRLSMKRMSINAEKKRMSMANAMSGSAIQMMPKMKEEEGEVPSIHEELTQIDDNQEEGVDDDDLLQMLKDSFREVTGHAMPAGMTLQEGYAALRLKTVASWMADGDELPTASTKGPGTLHRLQTSPMDKMRRGIRKSRMSLRMGKVTIEDPLELEEGGLADEDWDQDLIDMLKDSYREVTGRSIPPGLSYQQAERELRNITMNRWQDEGWATVINEEEEKEGWDEALDRGTAKSVAAIEIEATMLPTAPAPNPVSPGKAVALLKGTFCDLKVEAEDQDLPKPPRLTEFDADTGDEMDDEEVDNNRLPAVGEEWPPRPSISGVRPPTSKDVYRSKNSANGFQISATKVYESWLTKKAPGLFKQSKMRYFMLFDNGEVHYFTNSDMLEHKGMITVSGLATSNIIFHGIIKPGEYAFTIKTELREWYFTSDNESQCRAWKKNLDATIKKIPDNSEGSAEYSLNYTNYIQSRSGKLASGKVASGKDASGKVASGKVASGKVASGKEK